MEVLDPFSTVTEVISPGGGTLTLFEGDPEMAPTELVVPGGAVDRTMTVSMRRLNPQSVPSREGQAPFNVYEFGPSHHRFKKPVTITFLYPDEDQDGKVDGTTVDETSLKVFWHDDYGWQYVGGTVDTTKNTMTARVRHFSVYGVFPSHPLTADMARPATKIITPNGDQINDFVQFNIDGDFMISIYDIRGRRIRKLVNDNVWDGRREDKDMAESGTYLYELEGRGLSTTGVIEVAR
jgi:gliding motility-associated-like protein